MKKFFKRLWNGIIAWGEFVNNARQSRIKNTSYWYY